MIVKRIFAEGLERCRQLVSYVMDFDKVLRKDLREQGVREATDEIRAQQDLNPMIIIQDGKLIRPYITGRFCDPRTAEEDMLRVWFDAELTRVSRSLGDVKRDIPIWHIVQSWPAGEELSAEEQHQCGLELAELIGPYPALICSQLHPELAEEECLNNRCQHNHILLLGIAVPSMWDPEHPDRIKYNADKRSLSLLMQYNDTVALDRGYSIVINPDMAKNNSHYERMLVKQQKSWKEQVRADIKEAVEWSESWEEYELIMSAYGYQMRVGGDVTYTTPQGFKIKDKTLGREYTKTVLQKNWDDRRNGIKQEEEIPQLAVIAYKHGEITADIPLGPADEYQQTYHYPLDEPKASLYALCSYFAADMYNIRNAAGELVAEIRGSKIVSYLEGLRAGKGEQWMASVAQYFRDKKEEEMREARKAKERLEEQRERYRMPPKSELYDENGRRRTTLEMLFILLVVIIRNEDGLWDTSRVPEDQQYDFVFGGTDWALQRTFDAIHLADVLGIENYGDLLRRIEETEINLKEVKTKLAQARRNQDQQEVLREYQYCLQRLMLLDDPKAGMGDEQETEEEIRGYYNSAREKAEKYDLLDENGNLIMWKMLRILGDSCVADYDVEMLEKREEELKKDYVDMQKVKREFDMTQAKMAWESEKQAEISKEVKKQSGLDAVMKCAAQRAGKSKKGIVKEVER